MIIEEYKKPFTVITFDPSVLNHKNKLEEYLSKKNYSSNKRSKNYSFSKFNLNDQICISYILYENSIIGFSSLYHRKEYFFNSVRCLNRIYYDTSIRKSLKLFNPKNPIVNPIMIEHQYKFLDRNKFSMMFISKEVFMYRFCNSMTKDLNKYTSLSWYTDDKLYPLCNTQGPACWQHLMYSVCNDKKIKLLEKGISENVYRQKF